MTKQNLLYGVNTLKTTPKNKNNYKEFSSNLKKLGLNGQQIKAINEVINSKRINKNIRLKETSVSDRGAPKPDNRTVNIGSGTLKKGKAVGFPDNLFKEGSRLLNAYVTVLKLISPNWSDDQLKLFIQTVIQFYNHKIKHHGVTGGTSKYKIVANYLVNLAEGLNPENPIWVSTERVSKVPTDLLPLRVLVDSIRGPERNLKDYQVLVTVLAIPRLSKELPNMDLSSIENKMTPPVEVKFNHFMVNFKSYVNNTWNLNIPKNPDMTAKPSLRMSAGPNGSPSLQFAAEEAKLLLGTKSLGLAFKDLCTLTGNMNLYRYTSKFLDIDLDISNLYLAKLILVPDSMNKHRLVAMLDYWTNVILAPVEAVCKSVIKLNLQSDHMNNHGSGAQVVKSKSTCKSWSIDIKEFTNRLPARMQQVVLGKVLNPKIADAWYRLLVDRDFWVPAHDKYVRYGVGQPQGSKGSFVIASLTHHAIIHYAFNLVQGEGNVNELYEIVGDDLVIHENEVLKDKVLQIYEEIGLEISKSKSKYPVGDLNWSEFCSRVFVNGIDVSRISPNVINQASKDWRDVPLLLSLLRDREVTISKEILPSFSILCKQDKQGVTYLQLLKDALLSEMIGLENLREIGESLPGINTWETLNISKTERALLILNYSVAKALSVLQEAFDQLEIKLSTSSVELIRPVRDPITKEWYTPGPYDHSQPNKFGLNPQEETSIYGIASRKEMQPSGWTYEFPHPSAIASIYHYHNCLTLMSEGINGMIQDYSSPIEIINNFVQEIGYSVKAILPKEANAFVVSQSDKTDYYKNRVILSQKLLKAVKESRLKNTNTIYFDDIRCEFRLPRPEDTFKTNLLLRRLDLKGQPEDRLVLWYFKSIMTDGQPKPVPLQEWMDKNVTDPLSENLEEDEPEWLKTYKK
jgi:hypothetical protein